MSLQDVRREGGGGGDSSAVLQCRRRSFTFDNSDELRTSNVAAVRMGCIQEMTALRRFVSLSIQLYSSSFKSNSASVSWYEYASKSSKADLQQAKIKKAQ